MSDNGARFLARQFGLTLEEAQQLADWPEQQAVLEAVEQFRIAYGWPMANSPLVRGFLLSLIPFNRRRP